MRETIPSKLLGQRVPTLPSLRTPAPRHDRTAEAYVERLCKAIKADARCQPHVGRSSHGWRIADTDGHRAILVPSDADLGRIEPLHGIFRSWPTCCVKLEPAIYNAVGRMRAAGKAGKVKDPPVVRLQLAPEYADDWRDCRAGRLTLSTSAVNDGVEYASEWLDVTGTGLTRVDVVIDTRYLLDGLGLWPAWLRIGEPTTPVWIVTEATRYVVMPIRRGKHEAGEIAPYTVGMEDWPA